MERAESAQVEVPNFDGELDILVGDARIKIVNQDLDAHGYVWP